jgi:integral membrane protein
VLAWVTGIALLVLTVAVVVRLTTGDARLSHAVAPIHGWLYFAYFVVSFALAYRYRWPLGRSALVLVAGTIPFASFVAERRVTGWLAAREAAPDGPAPAEAAR